MLLASLSMATAASACSGPLVFGRGGRGDGDGGGGEAGGGGAGANGGHGATTSTTSGGGGACIPPRDDGTNPCDLVAGCALWLRGDLGVTQMGSAVSAWADQSGSGHDASQSNASSRPGLHPDGGAGCTPALDFQKPSGKWMNVEQMAGMSSDHTVFAAIVQRPPAGIQLLLSTIAAYDFAPAATVTPTQLAVGGLDRGTWRNAGAAVAGPQFLTWVWAEAASTLTTYRDGLPLGTASYQGGLQFGNPTTLGKYRAGVDQSNGHYLDALVSEVIVYDRALDAADLVLVHGYLGTRYAL
jgi:hypothetical protein